MMVERFGPCGYNAGVIWRLYFIILSLHYARWNCADVSIRGQRLESSRVGEVGESDPDGEAESPIWCSKIVQCRQANGVFYPKGLRSQST